MKRVLFVLMCIAVFCAPAFAAKPIVIGQIATVTGDFAAYGVAEVEAVKIAVKEINDAGGVLGRPLEVIMYDCRTRQEDMVNAARRLVEQDRVCAVVGPTGSGICIAGAPVFNRRHVPQVMTLPTNPERSGRTASGYVSLIRIRAKSLRSSRPRISVRKKLLCSMTCPATIHRDFVISSSRASLQQAENSQRMRASGLMMWISVHSSPT